MNNIIDVCKLPLATNICNQTLREVIAIDELSIAHVTMEIDAESLLHRHNDMTEIYYILEGNGLLYNGEEIIEVCPGANIIVDKNTFHKLKNTGKTTLEHLVIAIPPFSSEDIILGEEVKSSNENTKKYVLKKETFEASDGAKVIELFTKEQQQKYNLEMAYGFLQPSRKAVLHYHKISKEIYYIISGEGNVRLGETITPIKKGTLILVPINTNHGLENISSKETLDVICLSVPLYIEEDFIKL